MRGHADSWGVVLVLAVPRKAEPQYTALALGIGKGTLQVLVGADDGLDGAFNRNVDAGPVSQSIGKRGEGLAELTGRFVPIDQLQTDPRRGKNKRRYQRAPQQNAAILAPRSGRRVRFVFEFSMHARHLLRADERGHASFWQFKGTKLPLTL